MCLEPDVQEKWSHLWDAPPQSKEELDALHDHYSYMMLYAIVLNKGSEEGKAVGRVCLMDINPEHGTAMVGAVYYGKKIEKTAAATEVIYVKI
jgi:RimJ/RimL family protein N-acetyltransferase